MNGYRIWVNEQGQPHAEGRPAIVHESGVEYWMKNGQFHRLDGPAVVVPNEGEEYWIDGKRLTREEWLDHQQPLADVKVYFRRRPTTLAQKTGSRRPLGRKP